MITSTGSLDSSCSRPVGVLINGLKMNFLHLGLGVLKFGSSLTLAASVFFDGPRIRVQFHFLKFQALWDRKYM